MAAIVGLNRPTFNMDDVHRRTLDESLTQFGLMCSSTNAGPAGITISR